MKGKNNMTNKQIKKNLVQDMKKDIELKKYAKDIEDLNTKQFKILINVFKKFKIKQLIRKEKSETRTKKNKILQVDE